MCTASFIKGLLYSLKVSCIYVPLTRNEGLNGLINCSHIYKSSLFQEPIIVAEKVKYLCGEGEDTLPNGNNQVKSWEDSSWISHLKSVWFCILARSHGLYFLSSFRYPVSHSSVTFSYEYQVHSWPKGAKKLARPSFFSRKYLGKYQLPTNGVALDCNCDQLVAFLQGDHSGWFKPLTDTRTKVMF